jgi:hypothetical protein
VSVFVFVCDTWDVGGEFKATSSHCRRIKSTNLLLPLDVPRPLTPSPHPKEAFTAGDFVRRAEAAIDDVLGRGRVPVVVGGTSMYTQWLVQGRPDAPRSDPKVEAQAREMLAPLHARGDWTVR